MDLFSGLFGDSGGSAGALGALLPLLLGGMGKGDLGSLAKLLGQNDAIGALGSILGGRKAESSYPPLFGAEQPPFDLIASVMNGGARREDKAADPPKTQSYPYELQYNRPEQFNKK